MPTTNNPQEPDKNPPPPITYQQFQQMLLDTSVPDKEIARYVFVDKEVSTPLNPVLKAKPEYVLMTTAEAEAENAMAIGNGLARLRRQLRFKEQLALGSKAPVLVSEGDSWFQFPILIDDVIDQLGKDYLVWDVSAAGDTAQNMVFGVVGKGHCEYLNALRDRKDRVRAFLFSAAGNDIIGQDEAGVPMLARILKKHVSGGSPSDHIDFAVFGQALTFLKKAYSDVITKIRKEPGFEKLPIIVHGYDYAIPSDAGPDEPRHPIYAKQDEWLGKPLAEKGITDPSLQRGIIRRLIDGLYDMLDQVAHDHPHVHVVNVRGTLPQITDWNDEIHGTSAGFEHVAGKFKAVLAKVLA